VDIERDAVSIRPFHRWLLLTDRGRWRPPPDSVPGAGRTLTWGSWRRTSAGRETAQWGYGMAERTEQSAVRNQERRSAGAGTAPCWRPTCVDLSWVAPGNGNRSLHLHTHTLCLLSTSVTNSVMNRAPKECVMGDITVYCLVVVAFSHQQKHTFKDYHCFILVLSHLWGRL